ncbi:MAG: CCA tRNA nucleotidyltransferase [Anaerolineae bacterium]|nr:CCA tRNA nucleotidyltransferase [Anaerolineae bacterium]
MPASKWVPDPQSKDFAPYAGRWVACLGGRVVAQGGTPQQALQAAKANRFKETPTVFFVPIMNSIPFSPLLMHLRAALPDDIEIYLVGGSVRDLLLGRTSHDYDFAMPGDALRVARALANAINGAYYPLDAERGTARIIYTGEDGKRVIIDFASLRGNTLEEDLAARDFTINALALDLRQPDALLDPLGGAADLHAKILRACSNTSLQADPLRVLRAIRLAASYDLRIDTDTRQQIRAVIPMLAQVSPERTRDELFRIFETPRLATSIRALDILGALDVVLPEMASLKNLAQSSPHTLDAWQHTLETARQMGRLLHVLGPTHDDIASGNLLLGLAVMRLGRYRQQITDYVQQELIVGRSVLGLLFAAALYHDIGKPQSQQAEEGGRIRFLEHERIGSEMVVERVNKLHFGNAEINWVQTVVQQHMRPTWLANQLKSEQMLSRRAVYRFFRATGETGPAIVLLSLADLLATYGPGIPPKRWRRQLDVGRALLEAWWEHFAEQVAPPALLNGHDLMTEFELEPGPIIGETLDAIKEAQVVGDVTNRENALKFAADFLNMQ